MKGEFVFGSFWRQGDSAANDFDFGNSQYEIANYKDHRSLSLLITQDVLLER
jgi:hypothetical protein